MQIIDDLTFYRNVYNAPLASQTHLIHSRREALECRLRSSWERNGRRGQRQGHRLLCWRVRLCGSVQGGNNAGHTVVNDRGTFKIHLVPSGIFHPNTRCLLGSGMVIDPAVLIEELAGLRAAGIRFEKRLFISPRAHLIMPYHKFLDGLYEHAKGAGATGTTRRGIGPAFADKISYNGLRWTDFRDRNNLVTSCAFNLT